MSSNEQYLRIGKIVGAHGLHGRLKVFIVTDIIERFNKGSPVFVECEQGYREYQIEDFAEYKKKICLLRLEGITDIDAVLLLKGRNIYIHRNEAEKTRVLFDKESYYYYDLIGCNVFRNNMLFGVMVDILAAGAGEILIIEDTSGKRVMVPFVESMVDTEQIFEGRLNITPINGLIE